MMRHFRHDVACVFTVSGSVVSESTTLFPSALPARPDPAMVGTHPGRVQFAGARHFAPQASTRPREREGWEQAPRLIGVSPMPPMVPMLHYRPRRRRNRRPGLPDDGPRYFRTAARSGHTGRWLWPDAPRGGRKMGHRDLFWIPARPFGSLNSLPTTTVSTL
jgi:hypothetical protein